MGAWGAAGVALLSVGSSFLPAASAFTVTSPRWRPASRTTTTATTTARAGASGGGGELPPAPELWALEAGEMVKLDDELLFAVSEILMPERQKFAFW